MGDIYHTIILFENEEGTIYLYRVISDLQTKEGFRNATSELGITLI